MLECSKDGKKTIRTATYTYDSNNNRKEMAVGNKVTAYKYNKNDELLRTDTLNTDTEEDSVVIYKNGRNGNQFATVSRCEIPSDQKDKTYVDVDVTLGDNRLNENAVDHYNALNTIYRDRRNVVGTFFVREGEISGFAKVGKNYFVCITHVEEQPVTFDIENITHDIAQIDLATQSVKVLLGNCAWDGDRGEIKINTEDIVFYRGSMYYDSRTDVLWNPGDYVPGAFLMSRDLKNVE